MSIRITGSVKEQIPTQLIWDGHLQTPPTLGDAAGPWTTRWVARVPHTCLHHRARLLIVPRSKTSNPPERKGIGQNWVGIQAYLWNYGQYSLTAWICLPSRRGGMSYWLEVPPWGREKTCSPMTSLSAPCLLHLHHLLPTQWLSPTTQGQFWWGCCSWAPIAHKNGYFQNPQPFRYGHSTPKITPHRAHRI